MDRTLFEELLAFLEEYTGFYQSFFELETDKYVAITQNHLKELDDFVKREQAMMLKSRGMEQERERRMKAAGCPDLKFRELPERVPPELSEAFSRVYDEMTQVFQNLKIVNQQSNNLVQIRLRRIGEAASQLEPRPGEYKPDARTTGPRPQSISKKV